VSARLAHKNEPGGWGETTDGRTTPDREGDFYPSLLKVFGERWK